ncbi:MAG: (2Fe-2S)-binding protein [Clostridia bacterium]|nr:(2Fe-2S)-binding protein [Clostridia bacterium]
MDRNKKACNCRNVTYGMIEDAVKNGAETLQQFIEVTGAGKGCGRCKEFIEFLIRDIKNGNT